MNGNTITIILIVGDPGPASPQLHTGNLALTAQLIEHSDATTPHGKWDAEGRSSLWLFTVDRSRAEGIKEQLRNLWAGQTQVTWRPAGTAPEVITS